tara:strand:- start:258 stop:596 length:339 start_codon:yes stop_codon:yes gene_type:complete
MGKKENKKEQSPLEQITELSQEAQKELSKITQELLGLAKQVKEEFGEDDNMNMDEFDEQMNEMSASITQIHQDSPYLDEMFEGDAWKKVIKTGTPIPPIKPMKKEDNEDGEK